MLKAGRFFAAIIALVPVLCPPLPAVSQEGLSQAIALYQKKDYKSASRALYTVAQGNSDPKATYYLALCYEQLHYHAQAVELFNRISKLWPDSDEGQLSAVYIQKLTEKEAQDKQAAALKADPKLALMQALKKPLSKAEWDALPAKVRFPITKTHGHLMVTAKVNGRYIPLAFDTGASMCGVSLYDFPDLLANQQIPGIEIPVARPHGMVMAKVYEAEISLNDLTRKVRVLGINEPQVSVIGQNFFKEYTYQVDDFYVRLTKSPYTGGEGSPPTVAEVGAKERGTVVGPGTAGGVNARGVTTATPVAKAAKKYDRYTIPFEKDRDTMIIDIEINGYKTKAIFDTGCAPDGVVCHPSIVEQAHLTHAMPRGNRADRVVIGSIIKMDVPVYFAVGLKYPLVGPKIFNRPFTVDQAEQCIRFDY